MDNFVLGALDSGVDLRDYTFDMVARTSRKKTEKIPDSFVLPYKYPILNQGSIGSCVAHALSELKSYIDGVLIADMYSVGYIYGNREDDDHQGTGMVTREALANLVKFGDCYKKDFPVNQEYPAIKSTIDSYGKDRLANLASEHKSTAYIKLYDDEIKEYLYIQQKPIVICIDVYKNFYDFDKNKGVIPSEPIGDRRGGHAMIIIGYDKDQLIIVNSWGDYTGDRGKVYLDINSPIIRELWALEDQKNIIKPEPVPTSKYKIGWNKDNKGWWYSPDGNTYYTSSWKLIKNIWYYFKEDGYAMENDWLLYKGSWYFLEPETCAMATSKWVRWKEKWYYFKSDGIMATGWITVNNKTYYLNSDGAMINGVNVLINGKYYTFDPSGALV